MSRQPSGTSNPIDMDLSIKGLLPQLDPATPKRESEAAIARASRTTVAPKIIPNKRR